MQDRDTGGLLETANVKAQELLLFVQQTEFGTPQFQAISDYLNLRELERNLDFVLGQMSKGVKAVNDVRLQSRRRRTEMKMALLEHTIAQNQAGLRRYSAAYSYVCESIESINSAAHIEVADSDFSARKQKDYKENVSKQIHHEIQVLIWEKREEAI